MITLNHANKVYNLGDEVVKALDDVNLVIAKGQFLAIVGPSGSGKSTLMNMIGGLDELDSGDIVVNGTSLKKLNDQKLAQYRNKTIGFIFQNFNLQHRYTALENVELALIFAGLSKNERKEKAKEALVKVGLSNRLNHKPTELSGGQQQRVSIARAIVNNPQILLADEPTGNLDSKSGEKIIELLKDLNEKLGVTLIVVTHDDRIAHKAHRIIHIFDGKITDDILNGKNDLVKKYTD